MHGMEASIVTLRRADGDDKLWSKASTRNITASHASDTTPRYHAMA